jgi:hypothetical protein
MIGHVLKLWPAPGLTPEDQDRFERKKRCLQQIVRDKEGTDSANLMVARFHTAYYITTDYDYHHRFNKRKTRIKEKCRVEAFILTPSEFMRMYETREI